DGEQERAQAATAQVVRWCKPFPESGSLWGTSDSYGAAQHRHTRTEHDALLLPCAGLVPIREGGSGALTSQGVRGRDESHRRGQEDATLVHNRLAVRTSRQARTTPAEGADAPRLCALRRICA